MRFDLLRPDDERWSSFLTRSKYDVYHLPAYCSLLADERGMTARACYGESEAGSLLLPVLIDHLPENLGLPPALRDARSPDGYPGPLCSGDAPHVAHCLPDLMTFLRDTGIVTLFVRAHPILGMATNHFETVGDVVDRGRTIAITLDATYDQIQRRMRQGHRYEIRRALAAGYEVTWDRWDLLPELVSMYRALMDRVDAAGRYRFSDRYFNRFKDVIGDSAHIVFVLSRDGSPAGGALFTHCGDIIQYHLAASDPDFAADAVQKLVVDALIRYGLDHGAETVHLGGGVGAGSDSLLHFKAGFSRTDLPYRTIEMTPNPDACRAANQAWSLMSGLDYAATGFFPPYRTPPGSGE